MEFFLKVAFFIGHDQETVQQMRVKFVWYDKTKGTTCIPSFVQLWDGHVKILVDMTWNDPTALTVM